MLDAAASAQDDKDLTDDERFNLEYESLALWNKYFAVSLDAENPSNPIRQFPDWPVLREFDYLWLKYRFSLWPKSRRLFVTWRSVGNYLWDAIAHRARYNFLQSRKLSDAGVVGDYALGSRAIFILEHLPKCVRPKWKVRKKDSLIWVWPPTWTEKATIHAVSADFDAFRSYPTTGALLDEVAMQEHPERSMLAARGGVEEVGRLTGVSTPDGENFFYRACYNIIEGDEERKRYTPLTEYRDWAISRRTLPHMTDTGFFVGFMHDSCLPWRDRETAKGREWYSRARKGYTSDNDWNREHEIDWQAHTGTPIFPDFHTKTHVAEEIWGKPMQPIPNLPMIRGWDPGHKCGVCVWMQIVDGNDKSKTPQVRIYAEQASIKQDIGDLADRVLAYEDKHFPQFKGNIWDFIDVAAKQPSQNSKIAAITILGHKGINAQYRKSGPEDRILEINYLLNNRTAKSEPCFVMNARSCPRLYSAMRGLYRRKEGSKEIEPNEATHPIDALGYGVDNNLHLRFKTQPKEKTDDWNILVEYGIDKGKQRPSVKGWRSY